MFVSQTLSLSGNTMISAQVFHTIHADARNGKIDFYAEYPLLIGVLREMTEGVQGDTAGRLQVRGASKQTT